MSRRNDTPVPEFKNARKAPKAEPQEAPPHAETKVLVDEPRPPDPLPAGTPPPTQVPEPVQPAPASKLGRFATKAELDAVMLKYEGKGVCPLCQVRIGRGIHGHVSKCLRLQNSKLESTPIT